ncbi:electron carrier, partial [Linderina macrospora]
PHFEAAAVNDTDLKSLVDTVWQMADSQEFLQRASGHMSVVRVSAKKPAYNVGSAAALSFGKKRTAEAKKKAWMINVASDDEDEIEDQDELLEEEDLAKPDAKSLARPDGLPAKRKACKNCTCGLADGEEPDPTKCKPTPAKPKIAKPKKPVDVVNVKSACGNCSLGDAFRCTSCPYMGMPAFKPGDKITLGGSLLHDDFIP